MTDPQGFNRYAHVRNDPVNFADPTGLAGQSLANRSTTRPRP